KREKTKDMETEKIRNMTEAELAQQERELNDQLFRLKFQLKMGQTESLKKIRDLRKDVARVKTIGREKTLGIVHAAGPRAQASTGATATAAAPAKAAKSKAAKKSVKKAAGKSATAKTKARKK